MTEEIKLESTFSGFNIFLKEFERIIGLRGDYKPVLLIGMKVFLLGDSKGYIPSGFIPGDEVTIIEFCEPFLNYHSDDIIKVTNGVNEGWIKPSNIQSSQYHSKERAKQDTNLRLIQRYLSKEIGSFLETIYRSMPDNEKANLPVDTGGYVDTIITYVLNNLSDFGDLLAEAIAKHYKEVPNGPRFIKDPLRTNNDVISFLYLDTEGYLVSVTNPETAPDAAKPHYQFLKAYDSYTVLNGPLRGKKFYAHLRPLGEPFYNSTLSHTFLNHTSPESAKLKEGQKSSIRVFISYAHEDEKFKDQLVEHLSGLKNNNIISDWTDRQILGGQIWDDRINKNLEDSKIIIFLVSSSFMKSSYINEVEIKRSIEKHEKGEAIVIPVIVRFCDFESLPLQAFQALPKNARPIEDWKPRSKGWLDVIIQLKQVIQSLE